LSQEFCAEIPTYRQVAQDMVYVIMQIISCVWLHVGKINVSRVGPKESDTYSAMSEIPPSNNPPSQKTKRPSDTPDGATTARRRIHITADEGITGEVPVHKERKPRLVIDAQGNEVAAPRKPRTPRSSSSFESLAGDPNSTMPPPSKPTRKQHVTANDSLPPELYTIPVTNPYTGPVTNQNSPLASRPNYTVHADRMTAQHAKVTTETKAIKSHDPNATVSSSGSWGSAPASSQNNQSNGQSQSRALQIPQTITLPAILTNPGLKIPQPVAPDTAKMHIALKSSSLNSHPIVVIPGGSQLDTTMRVAPQLHHTAKVRSHRNVLVGLLIITVVLALSFVPLSRALGAQTKWLGVANGLALPTITPTPQPIYPDHPVVGGSYNFICTALPFARLANQRMEEAGMSHPWYVSTILAQWGVEFGWSMPSYTGYNFGNVSGIPGYPAVGGINVPGSPSSFAYAYTPLQGVDYYVLFVQNGYYNNVADAYPRGPIAQALAIGASPWDADHYNLGGQWGGKLTSAIQTFDLTRFDNPNVQC